MRCSIIVLICLLASVPCGARIITVNDNGPADFNNIQAAIDDANDGDTVSVSVGIYTGDGNRDIDFKGKAITVRSDSGPENCVIDCQGEPNHYYRGFYFHNNEDERSILDGFTITNGCVRVHGGGIFCEQSSPMIKNCIVTNNRTMSDPEGGTPYGFGAGICCLDSSPVIVDCRIIGNIGTGYGMGYCMGGGISCYGSSPLIKNCMISENSAARGGAIDCVRGCHPTVINSLMTGNYAQESGGAIAAKIECSLNIINCTFTGNSAVTGMGGAMNLLINTATITNSILWDNSPSEFAYTPRNYILVTYSNIKGGWPGEGNIDVEPLFASPSDYHLVFGSPCIDAGTNTPPSGLPIIDLDGITRPFDGDYDGNSIADMGTYEFHRNPGNPVLALTPARFNFTCPLGGPDPNDRNLYIWNAGGGLLNWQIAEDANWLHVHPKLGESTGEIDETVISVDTNGLTSDKYDSVLTVFDPCDSNNVRFVPVTFRVGPTLCVPDDYNNIQAAINAAFEGDEVIVADGVYTGEGNHDIDFYGKAITVRSENGPSDCVIDCQGTEQNPRRGFYFHSCENEDSVLDGFTIINGYCSGGALAEGGGIFCINAHTNPTIRNCIIRENKARSGGGVCFVRTSPTIINCIISNNHAYYDKGGGILCWDHSDAKIIGCTIVNNEAKYLGGGTYFRGGSPELTNCILWYNIPSQIEKREKNPDTNLSVSFSDVQNGWSGESNIDADPCFVALSIGDFHLLPYSPCVNAGDPYYNPSPGETDIFGEPRIMQGRLDIGADELNPEAPGIGISVTQIDFISTICGPNPESQTLSIFNKFGGILNWRINNDCDWLDVWPISGQSSGDINNVEISIDTNYLKGGKYRYDLIISDTNALNSPQCVTVTLDIKTTLIAVDSTQFSFAHTLGGPNPDPQILTIWNDGICTLNWQIAEECNWLDVSPKSGHCTSESNEVTLIIDSSNLGLGTYECNLVISDQMSLNSPKNISISLFIEPDIIYVPDQFPTIQEGIDNVLEGGIVIVAEGIYTGFGNVNIDFGGKELTLRSLDPSDPNIVASTVIDCNNMGRGFYFHSGENENSILDGFTITNGYIMTMCEAGAGIRIDNSSPTIRNCIITNNVAELDPLSLCYCYGGGIYFNGTTLSMTNCTISDNSAGGWGLGGGICCMSGSSTTLRNCIISNNTATTSALGGGIYLDYYTNSLNVVNCTIAENTASSDGGGIYFEQYENPPRIIIINSILWDNSPNQISTYGGTYKGLVAYCDIQGSWLGAGIIDADPYFADVTSGDYHLRSEAGRWDPSQEEWIKDANTSPCIDSGGYYDWTGELWPHGQQINMGAYGGTPQASMSLSDAGNIADLNNDGSVDYLDLMLFTDTWPYHKILLPGDLDRNGFVDFIDFAIFSYNWGWEQ